MATVLQIVGAVAVVLIVLVIGAYLAGAYNSLVRLNRKAEQAKQNIDVKLKQRHDTLSKLVDTISTTRRQCCPNLPLRGRPPVARTRRANRRPPTRRCDRRYNTRIKQAPYLLFAAVLGYDERELFDADAADIEDVDVSAAFDGAASPDARSDPAGDDAANTIE